jgi:beta-mannosidase
VALGNSLEEFINNSQIYQSRLIQFATEIYRRNKYRRVTGSIQFDFSDPWPAITWSVVDYWRATKSGYEALQRAMQPVLPCFKFPFKIKAGRVFQGIMLVVNDLLENFPSAVCFWSLEQDGQQAAGGSLTVDVPVDGISTPKRIRFTALDASEYCLKVILESSSGRLLGENCYEVTIQG